ncbi:MAG TPA: recombinase family protein [Ruminococcaceae bacterium]|nr:recombinase family protein [Oscillospiraceae bacterium]
MLTKAQTDMRVTMIPAKPKEEISGGIDTIKRVAAYCRVSTDQDDQINSYEAQCSFFTECIDSHEGWKKVKVFADEGITGTQAKKRPEFMKMLRYCRQGRIDIILAKSFSRFARNTVESIQYVRELKSLGIAVIFDKENINTLEQTDEMLITLFSWFAQAESESISKNVTWGIRRSFEQGNFSMHYSTTLGYERGEDGEPKIVPEEAETIRMIYSMFLDGSSYRDIAKALTEQGRKKASGKTDWTHANVMSILKNEKYAGDALLQKTYVTDCISKKTKKNTGELPMYLVTDHHAAIIDRNTFKRAQVEISRRSCIKKASGKNAVDDQGKYSAKYALTNLMFCEECGAPYRRTTWTAKGYKEIVWRCVSRLEIGKKKCKHSPTLHEESLHRAIVDAINDFCDVREKVKAVLKESVQRTIAPEGKTLAQLEKLKKEMNDEVSRLLDLTLRENDYTKYDSEFKRLSDEIEKINEQIRTEQEKLTERSVSADTMQTILDRIENTNFQLTEYDDVMTRGFIERITVIDKHTIKIQFKGGYETVQTLD